MIRIRIAARDPGAAVALVPVAQLAAGSYEVDVWALPKAAEVFRQQAVEHRRLADPSVPVLEQLWDASPASVLLTGTSHYAPFEPHLWRIAREHGVASMAVLDGWANAERRFEIDRPDHVAALDAGQVRELTALGFDPARILVAGHAWLRRCEEKRPSVLAENRPAGRRADTQVLFVSEPIAADVQGGFNADYGFDEWDAFHYLWRACDRVAGPERRIGIAVKLHPYQDPGQSRARFSEGLAALDPNPHLAVELLPASASADPWVLWSDLVCGIGSILLLESVVLGRPVVSLQPGCVREDTFVASRRGYAARLTTEGHLAKLTELLRSPELRAEELRRNRSFLSTIPSNPEERIMDWIRAGGR